MTRLFVRCTGAAAAILAASTGLAAAHDTRPIERELDRQAQLIEDGRRSGELTVAEVRQLQDQQARIVWMLRGARYDGNVTRRELNAIREAQDAAARSIGYEMADADVSRWRRYSDRRDDDWDTGTRNGWGRGWGYGRWDNRYGVGNGYRGSY